MTNDDVLARIRVEAVEQSSLTERDGRWVLTMTRELAH